MKGDLHKWRAKPLCNHNITSIVLHNNRPLVRSQNDLCTYIETKTSFDLNNVFIRCQIPYSNSLPNPYHPSLSLSLYPPPPRLLYSQRDLVRVPINIVGALLTPKKKKRESVEMRMATKKYKSYPKQDVGCVGQHSGMTGPFTVHILITPI